VTPCFDPSDEPLTEDDQPQDRDLEDSDADETPTLNCPSCGEEVYHEADRCPECGEWIIARVAEPAGPPRGWFIAAAIAVLIGLFAWLLLW
jgi:rRNA maturation protein Nop10